MEKLHIQTKEKKDTLEIKCSVDVLNSLPLKVAMTTLGLLEENNKIGSFFVVFNKETENFISENKEKYKKLIKEENPLFSEISEIYFNGLKGPLYQDGNSILEVVEKIYENEKHCDNINIPKIPKIIYAMKHEKDSNYEMVLDIKKIDELNQVLGKVVITHTAVLYKDALNYKYQQENNKSSKTPYGISSNIIKKAWNEELKKHEYLKSFEGNLYILTHLFNSETKKIKNIDDLAKFVYIQESFRLNVEKDIKPKRKI